MPKPINENSETATIMSGFADRPIKETRPDTEMLQTLPESTAETFFLKSRPSQPTLRRPKSSHKTVKTRRLMSAYGTRPQKVMPTLNYDLRLSTGEKDKFKTVTSQFPNTTKNSGNVTVKTELTKPGLAETRHLSL